ncbi:hypothetical protein ANN_25681 [Periplaneta americana]|uniref:PID domain-containing protein n=1 Tax=Periplaneta americana TaxID=6978 RepID=A0ABQ8S435_PERAM|nr:hypothetical protein ANN_25681 [Periplaneta americana]
MTGLCEGGNEPPGSLKAREGCVEKPLSTLWKNYTGSSKPDVQMKVTVTQAGLKAVTKEHGLTEYWSHRITYCAAPASFPRIFCWVYRHEGRKLKQELRCHAVLCSKEAVARRMSSQLKAKLAQSLSEFKRDKVCRQNARLSLANSVYDNPSLPRRKILLSTGSHNYRPPLERSKSAPKLMVIEESLEEGEEDCMDYPRDHTNRLRQDAMVLNRLEEVGEEKYQESAMKPEEVSSQRHQESRGVLEGGNKSPKHRARLQRVNAIEEDDNDIPIDPVNSATSSDEVEEVDTVETFRSGIFRFDKSPAECETLPSESFSGRGTRSMLRFRGSGRNDVKRRVGWKLDGENEDCDVRPVNHHTERLLVIGSCKEGDVRRRIHSSSEESGGSEERQRVECESDEGGSNSLQSISSSASSSSDNSSTRCLIDAPSSCLKLAKPLAPYVYEDVDLQTPEDEVEVDLHPTGGPLKRRHPGSAELDRLSAQLRRSATFPPPGCPNGGEVSELDSLSEEDDAMETPAERVEGAVEEEDNVSDESGYAELMDVGLKEAGEAVISTEKDVPHHQLMKTILRANGRSSQCLQV